MFNFFVIAVKEVDHVCVIILQRECALLSIEDTWLVHINPEVIDVIGTSESVGHVHTLPVVTCFFIIKVNPS